MVYLDDGEPGAHDGKVLTLELCRRNKDNRS